MFYEQAQLDQPIYNDNMCLNWPKVDRFGVWFLTINLPIPEFCNYKWKVTLICFGFINYVGQESMCKVLQKKEIESIFVLGFQIVFFVHFLSIFTAYYFHLHCYYHVQLHALAWILMQNKWYGREGKLLCKAWLYSLSQFQSLKGEPHTVKIQFFNINS